MDLLMRLEMKKLLLLLFVVLLAQVSSAAVTTGVNSSSLQVVWAKGVSVNGTNTDQATVTIPYTKYIVRKITLTNPSSSLGATSTATIGVFTGAGGTGTTVVTAATVLGVTAATKFADLILAVTADTLTSSTLTIRTGVAQGSAITCDFYIIVDPVE